jgi:tetratricopeptide (TPR) repeat protein
VRRHLFFAAALLFVAAQTLAGCGGHELRTIQARTALDAGHPREAIEHINKQLGVSSDKDLPGELQGDNALLVLDRGTVQQSLTQFQLSQRDFQAADKAIDMLDLAHNAGDSIGEYVFSGSSSRYVAPPYEKLLINTLNMINYLETADLSGAKVEARRLSVMQRYIRDDLKEPDNAILGLGGFLAGFVYEKSGDANEALRYYDEALAFAGYGALSTAVQALAVRATYKSPRIAKALAQQEGPAQPPSDEEGDVVCVVGYGRVPHKIPKRIPIGLALTFVAHDIHPANREAANRLAAKGFVNWINYPTLAPEQGGYALPTCSIDGKAIPMSEAVNVSAEVSAQWRKIEGKIILSAITRLITRFAVGEGIEKAGGKSPLAFLASLGTQATLTALDTPDTRSWETLPARVAIGRVRAPAGRHTITAVARGVTRTQAIDVTRGGWAAVSLQALR